MLMCLIKTQGDTLAKELFSKWTVAKYETDFVLQTLRNNANRFKDFNNNVIKSKKPVLCAPHAHDIVQRDNHKQLQAVTLNRSRQWKQAKKKMV